MIQEQIGNLDEKSAKLLARKIFETYDRNQTGVIETSEIQEMMIDTYKSINKNFQPNDYDIDTYIKILDANNDGRVTLEDIETMVLRLMCSD